MTFFYQCGSIPFQRVDSVLSTYFHLFNYVFVIVILIAELKNRNCCRGSDLSHLNLSFTGCKKIIKKVSFLRKSLFVGVQCVMKCVFPVFEGNILLRKNKSHELSTFLILDLRNDMSI